MVFVRLAPSEILFSQDNISNHFGVKTKHKHKLIGETLDDILTGKCKITDLPTIRVTTKNGEWVSADNRRLWVFKKLQVLGECDRIVVEHVTNAKRKRHLLATKKCVLITIKVRGYEGGHHWRSRVSNITYTSECAIKPDAKHLEPEIQSEASIDSVLLNYYTETEGSTETIRSPIADSAFLSPREKDNKDISKEQDICEQGKDEYLKFSNDIFREKKFSGTFNQDRFFGTKQNQSSFNMGFHSEEYSFNVPEKCRDLNTTRSTDQSTSNSSNHFTVSDSFREISGNERNVVTQYINSAPPGSLDNEDTSSVSEKDFFQQKKTACDFSPQVITQGAYANTTTQHPYSWTEKTKESQNSSSKSRTRTSENTNTRKMNTTGTSLCTNYPERNTTIKHYQAAETKLCHSRTPAEFQLIKPTTEHHITPRRKATFCTTKHKKFPEKNSLPTLKKISSLKRDLIS